MLDYDTWQKVKEECENIAQVSFQRMSKAAQKAMQDAHADGAKIAGVALGGAWILQKDPSWYPGSIYCVQPSTWPGPAKPKPKPEYVDQPVVVSGGYRIAQPGEDDAHWLISVAHGLVGFCGFVYDADGREWCSPAPIFDQQPDGTHRLRVPKAVRFLKGATA
jgi:hypothetical protein